MSKNLNKGALTTTAKGVSFVIYIPDESGFSSDVAYTCEVTTNQFEDLLHELTICCPRFT